MKTFQEIRIALENKSVAKKAEFFPKFFKTGKGQYGEGDIFIGVSNPNCWEIAKSAKNLSEQDLEKLIQSKIHEERLVALMILVKKIEKAKTDEEKEKVAKFYLDNLEGVNNWDLVDISAPRILGIYFLDKKRDLLYDLAKSKSLWKERISVVTTLWFIRQNDLKDALNISTLLLKHDHDLIHKAVGWVLREVGKKDVKILEVYLKKNYKNIPRTALRYAIEKFPETKRKNYLQGKF